MRDQFVGTRDGFGRELGQGALTAKVLDGGEVGLGVKAFEHRDYRRIEACD